MQSSEVCKKSLQGLSTSLDLPSTEGSEVFRHCTIHMTLKDCSWHIASKAFYGTAQLKLDTRF